MAATASIGSRPLSAFGSRQVTERDSEIIDLSCGNCESCAAGSRSWCERPGTDGEREGRCTGWTAPTDRLDKLVKAALVASAAMHTDLGCLTVTVVGQDRQALIEMVLGLGATRVLNAPSTLDDDLLAALRKVAATGRPDVVLTLDNCRSAVLSARRGGVVCVGANAGVLPSLTELVQREVQVVGPGDLFSLLDALGPITWAAAVAAA
jgi:hypothetical protein